MSRGRGRGGKFGTLPADTAEARAEIAERIGSAPSQIILDGMVRSAREHGDRLWDPSWGPREVAARIRRAALGAELFAVTSSVQAMLFDAARSLPPETLEAWDLPSPVGLLRLASPWRMTDVNGEKVPISAFLWAQENLGHDGVSPGVGPDGKPLSAHRNGVVVYMFTDLRSDPTFGFRASPRAKGGSRAVIPAAAAPDLPGMWPFHVSTYGYGLPSWVWKDVTREQVDRYRRAEALGEAGAGAGAGLPESSHDGEVLEILENGEQLIRVASGDVLRAVPDPTLAFLKTFFAFVRSKIVTLGVGRPPRTSLKTLPPDLRGPGADVRVMQLRATESSGAVVPGSGRSLHTRHIRRAHWRRVWVNDPERPGEKMLRRIPIMATVVGPEGGEWVKGSLVRVVAR